MSECNSYAYDSQLGYMPAIPCPWYCWQFWRWQKVRCNCGKTFITRDLSLTPIEYSRHYILNHVEPSEPFPVCAECGKKVTVSWEAHSDECTPPASPTVTLDRETFNKIAALAMTVHHKSECKALPVNRGGSAYDNAWDDYCDCGLNDVLTRLRAAERQQ